MRGAYDSIRTLPILLSYRLPHNWKAMLAPRRKSRSPPIQLRQAETSAPQSWRARAEYSYGEPLRQLRIIGAFACTSRRYLLYCTATANRNVSSAVLARARAQSGYGEPLRQLRIRGAFACTATARQGVNSAVLALARSLIITDESKS